MSGPDHVTPTGWTVLPLTGRLDASTAPAVEQALLGTATAGARLALDLGGLDYLSSAGLRTLLSLLKAYQAQGGTVCLLRPRAGVREVLEISGFSTIFAVKDSEAELS